MWWLLSVTIQTLARTVYRLSYNSNTGKERLQAEILSPKVKPDRTFECLSDELTQQLARPDLLYILLLLLKPTTLAILN